MSKKLSRDKNEERAIELEDCDSRIFIVGAFNPIKTRSAIVHRRVSASIKFCKDVQTLDTTRHFRAYRVGIGSKVVDEATSPANAWNDAGLVSSFTTCDHWDMPRVTDLRVVRELSLIDPRRLRPR